MNLFDTPTPSALHNIVHLVLLSQESKIVERLGSYRTQRTQNTRFTSLELHSYCPRVMTHTHTHTMPKANEKGQGPPHLVNADHLERVRRTAGGVGRRRHLQHRETNTRAPSAKSITAAEAFHRTSARTERLIRILGAAGGEASRT